MSRSGHLTLWVPDLEALLQEAGDAIPPQVKRFRRLGRRTALDPEKGGSDLVVAGGLAAAAASRYFDVPASGLDSGAIWMRADPVMLKADLRSVWIQPSVAQNAAEAVECLRPIFSEFGTTLDFPHRERGYLRLTKLPACHFPTPDQVAGESMEAHLPEGPDQMLWRRLGNEVQMALHALSRDKEPGFQGLWFWGPGALPPMEKARPLVDWVAGHDPVLSGAAGWASLPCLERSENKSPRVLPRGSGLIEWTANPSLTARENLTALAKHLGCWLGSLRRGQIASLSLAGPSQMHTLGWLRSWWPLVR